MKSAQDVITFLYKYMESIGYGIGSELEKEAVLKAIKATEREMGLSAVDEKIIGD